MKKYLLALFALALLVAFTAPADAAKKMKKPAMKKAKKASSGVSLKMKGFYRVRAFSANNIDGDDDNPDSTQGIDSLFRPNFLTTVGKGHVKARWEIDWWETDKTANANSIWGQHGGGRVGVGTNRWHIDFAVPGSALRMRMGREDWTSPDREIFDSAGASRKPGIGLYGKLSKNMSLSTFMFRAGADTGVNKLGPEDKNKDSYFAALGIKVSPTTTLTPWVAMHRDGEGKSLTYAAMHAKTKVGIFGLSATGVSVGGDASATMDASGWAMLLRSSANLGKMKLLANMTMLSGDDNMEDNEEGRFHQLFPNAGDIVSGVLMGGRGNIMLIDANERIATPAGTGNSGKLQRTNGAFIAELGVKYQVSKTFNIGAGVYVYQSAEADAEGDEDFGTEFDVGMQWQIYPKLQLRAGFAYLAAGDYGADNDREDTWYTAVALRHIF